MSGDGSDVMTKPSRLDRGTISVMVLVGAIGFAGTAGFWLNGALSANETTTAKQLGEIERVFSERAAYAAQSQIAELGKLRLEIKDATSTLLAAIQASGERVSFLERDVRTWVALLDAQNPTLAVPNFVGK